MCATDALGMAPEVKLYDLRIEDDTISSAVFNFDWCIRQHRQVGLI
jgi:serine protease AprX